MDENTKVYSDKETEPVDNASKLEKIINELQVKPRKKHTWKMPSISWNVSIDLPEILGYLFGEIILPIGAFVGCVIMAIKLFG